MSASRTHSQRRASVLSLTSSPYHLDSTLAPNGQTASTQSATKNNVDHAGPSLPLRYLVTVSVSQTKPALYSAHNGSSAVTPRTWDATVETSHTSGNTWNPTVSQPTLVTHTSVVQETATLENALTNAPTKNSTPPPTSEASTATMTSKCPSCKADQSKPDSPYTKTSCHTRVESTPTKPEANSEAMPSKSSDGESKTEPTTGLLPTHGDQPGEWKDSSTLQPTNVELATTYT